jgi:tetratricopeptide (TPR) repeat protein
MIPAAIKEKLRAWADWPGWVWVFVGLTALLRLAHVWSSRSNPTFWAPAVDPGWYDQAAQDIVAGNWGPFPLFRAPAYPAMLALIYAAFGHDLVAARVLNVLLQAATVWVIWRVARSYLSPAAAFPAALLFAVNGTTIYFAGEILSTSAEMLAAAFGMWATFRLLRDHSRPAVVLCGLAWGAAAITRPNFLFVFPVAVLVVFVVHLAGQRRQDRFAREPWLAVLVCCAAAMAPILPVTAANYFIGGEPVLIATQGGVNFWIGNNPESTGILSVLPGYGNTWTMNDAEREAEREVGRPLNPGELSRFYYAKGRQFLAAHPWLTVRFMMRKTALFFNQFEISNNKHITYFASLSPWLPALIHLNFGVLVPLGLLGLWVLWRQPSGKILTGLTALYTISVVLFFVTSRFRMPAVPWLCVLAAGGIVWIAERIRTHASLRAWWPVLLLIPGSVLAYMNLWNLHEAPVGWARYMEGNAYFNLNRLDSARVCFEDAIRDHQAVGLSQLNLGVIAFRMGDTLGARKWYEASLETDDNNADAWNNLGTVYEALNDTAGALHAYLQALALRPSAPDPRHNLAGIHFRQGIAALKQGQDSLAIHHLETCIGLEPNAVAHYDVAIAYGRSGRNDLAMAHLEEALRMDPGLQPAMLLRERIRAGLPAVPAASSAP